MKCSQNLEYKYTMNYRPNYRPAYNVKRMRSNIYGADIASRVDISFSFVYQRFLMNNRERQIYSGSYVSTLNAATHSLMVWPDLFL